MKRMMIVCFAALAAALCACGAEPARETVDGGCIPTSGEAAYTIFAAVPHDAVEEVFAAHGTQHVYTQPGGGYEITTEILRASSPDAVIRQLSGFDASALHVYQSGSRSRPVWQFAWYAGSDEGGRMYRCKVVEDGAYCYALTLSVPEASASRYDTMAAELFSSMELQPV